ncbi:MAG: hypothetical protein U0163_04905 [Gemmatimonadaceae bacterium]
MTRKGSRDIPDFSKKPKSPMGKMEPNKNVAQPKPREPVVKQVNTAQKGGQRGR